MGRGSFISLHKAIFCLEQAILQPAFLPRFLALPLLGWSGTGVVILARSARWWQAFLWSSPLICCSMDDMCAKTYMLSSPEFCCCTQSCVILKAVPPDTCF